MRADNWSDCPKCKKEEKLRETFGPVGVYEGEFSVKYDAECGWLWIHL